MEDFMLMDEILFSDALREVLKGTLSRSFFLFLHNLYQIMH